MKSIIENLFLSDKLKNNILLFLGILLFAFPVLPTAIQSISVFIFIGFSIIYYFTKVTFDAPIKQYKQLAIITFWVIFLCITILYSNDKTYGLVLAKRYINILVLPIAFIFFIPSFFFQKRHYFFLSFIISNLLFVIIIYYRAITVAETTCFPEIYYSNFYDKLMFILKKPNYVVFSCFENEVKHSFFIHRVYNSMNFLFSVLLLIEMLFSKKLKKPRVFYPFAFLCIIIFTYLIFYQFSIANVVLALLLIPSYVLFKLYQRKLKTLIAILLLLTVTFIASTYSNFSNNRIAIKYLEPKLNLFKAVLTGKSGSNIDERYEINLASKHLINNKPIFGYGIGDSQQVLNQYYYNNKNNNVNYKTAFDKKLNSHNNYAFFLLSGGIVLLVLYVLNIIFCFYNGLVFKEWVYIIFLVIVSVNLVSENILSRIHGTLFYAIFNAFFIAGILRKEELD